MGVGEEKRDSIYTKYTLVEIVLSLKFKKSQFIHLKNLKSFKIILYINLIL